MQRRSVIIVGSGPAGSATALALAAADPHLARDAVLLDRAVHPRDKTCAGGVVPKALAVLRDLGVAMDVPQVRIDRARVDIPGRRLEIPGDDLCRVVLRREFDAHLAWTARDRGVALHEGHRVTRVERDGDGVVVATDRAVFRAPVVVGADGSGSVVRRALVDRSDGLVGRAVMVDVPAADVAWDGHARHRYEFDFRCVPDGVRGYRWAFPNLVGGVPHVNVGAYVLPPVDGGVMQRELRAALDEVGGRARLLGDPADPHLARWKAFPIRTNTAGPVAAPHALLVGDAAGCDPLMGEGISHALEYGVLAADAIRHAHRRGDWSFAHYQRAVDRGPLGRKLRLLRLATRLFYGRRTWPLAFRAAAASARAQAIGLAWYNGVDGWDERGPLAMCAALLTGRGPAPVADVLADA